MEEEEEKEEEMKTGISNNRNISQLNKVKLIMNVIQAYDSLDFYTVQRLYTEKMNNVYTKTKDLILKSEK